MVVATRSRSSLLRRCLEAVNAQEPPPFEILVVDNTHGEEATREVALAAGAQYLVEPIRGVSRARNRGARQAAGEIVAIVDDDAVPEQGWLAALAAEFADPRVAAVAGRILPLESDDDDWAILGGAEWIVLSPDVPDWFERASFGGLGQGSNLAVRRDVFDSGGGFDERLGAGTRVGGAEEHHLFLSLVDRGHHVVYTPTARVMHPFPDSIELVRLRHLRDLRTATSLLTLILLEKPHLRRRALRFALETLRGSKREWRTAVPGARQSGLRATQMRILGVGLYIASRADRRGR